MTYAVGLQYVDSHYNLFENLKRVQQIFHF